MRKTFAGVEEQHTLGFLYSKITVEDRFLHKFIFCVPSIWAFRYKLSKNFIIRRIHLMKTKRVPVQVHTRKLDRMVARKNMEKKGVTQINKIKGDASFFSKNWRDYVNA